MFSNYMESNGSAAEVFLFLFRRSEDLEKLRELTSPRSHRSQSALWIVPVLFAF